jgi:hypothetical protein
MDRELRRTYGPKREEKGGRRNSHNNEIHNFYSSSNIIRVMKSRSITITGHVARMGEMRNEYKILGG